MSVNLHVSSDVSLHQTQLAVINPVVCGSIFLTLTAKPLPAQRRRIAVTYNLTEVLAQIRKAHERHPAD